MNSIFPCVALLFYVTLTYLIENGVASNFFILATIAFLSLWRVSVVLTYWSDILELYHVNPLHLINEHYIWIHWICGRITWGIYIFSPRLLWLQMINAISILKDLPKHSATFYLRHNTAKQAPRHIGKGVERLWEGVVPDNLQVVNENTIRKSLRPCWVTD